MFINQIKLEGIKDYIYEEFKLKSAIDFANISNGSPLATATSLARKLNFIKDINDVKYIHKKPFVYEKLDKNDIKSRLDKMVPENMYIIYHSLKYKIEKEENPEEFKTEKWYSKDFKVEKLDD